MGFLTATKTIVRTRSDTFNDPAGNLDVTNKWTLLALAAGLPVNGTDIDATGADLREPTTATIAPHAYQLAHEIPIGRARTFRASMSVKGTSRVGATGAAFLNVFRPDLPVGLDRLTGRVGIINETNVFSMRWRGQTTTSAFTVAANTYYRVGIEFDIESGFVRGYLNPTGSVTTSAGDGALALRVQFAIDSGTGSVPYDDATAYVGVGISGIALSGSDYSGVENILIEEWLLPFAAPSPGGAFFPVLGEDSYAVHKSSLTLHERLNRAQIG